MRRQPSFQGASRNTNWPPILSAGSSCDPQNRPRAHRERDTPIREHGREAMLFGEDEGLRFGGTKMQWPDTGAHLPRQLCYSCLRPSPTDLKCRLVDFRFRYRAWLKDRMVSKSLSVWSSASSCRSGPRCISKRIFVGPATCRKSATCRLSHRASTLFNRSIRRRERETVRRSEPATLHGP
jgi:hypothetical protein